MNWKKQLEQMEHAQEWDAAILFMEKIIRENPEDADTYIFMNFLLMNLLVEENNWDRDDLKKHNYYAALAKKYFDASYKKFSENSEYLYYTAMTAVMAPCYFGIVQDEWSFIEGMLAKAQSIDPNNPVYKFEHYWSLFKENRQNKEAKAYATMVLDTSSPIAQILATKGAMGRYILEIMKYRSEQILGLRPYLP